ncbi:MAG: hypothetical protein IJQ58_11215 [Synergistaceae bacterium]|nr:hypothetical protein [Synergistaceae bacterium]
MNTYRIADKIIQVDSIHNYVHEYFKGYAYNGIPDFTVQTSQADIDSERAKSSDGGNYSDEYIESLAIYRKISEKMPEYDAFLFHGSCISVNGEGYIFTAPSGTGKSTHSALWRKLLGERAVMVNDDKPIIRITNGRAYAYGTPFTGKHMLGNNIHVPVKAVCVLHRSDTNHIEPSTLNGMYAEILRQTYRPYDVQALAKTLELLGMFGTMVKFYRLYCNMNLDAAEISYNAMKED